MLSSQFVAQISCCLFPDVDNWSHPRGWGGEFSLIGASLGSQVPLSVSLVGRTGERSSPSREAVNVETPDVPQLTHPVPLSAAGSVLSPVGSRTVEAAGV